MTLDDEQAPTTPGRMLLFVLACVLALVLPLLLMRQFLGAGDTASPPPPASTARATAASTGTAVSTATARGPAPAAVTTAPGSTALAAAAETCRLANLRQQAPLSAADVSLAQFDKHIDAMNLLVAGKITLSVATTFWDETRVGATQNAAAFRRADQELRANGGTCPTLDPAVSDAAPYGQVVALKSCSSAITARKAALVRARTAVSTWEHHIHDMEMLRMGHITPAQATAAWQRNWKTGEKELTAYEKALAKAKKISCPLD